MLFHWNSSSKEVEVLEDAVHATDELILNAQLLKVSQGALSSSFYFENVRPNNNTQNEAMTQSSGCTQAKMKLIAYSVQFCRTTGVGWDSSPIIIAYLIIA